jgi:hypothetical protein
MGEGYFMGAAAVAHVRQARPRERCGRPSSRYNRAHRRAVRTLHLTGPTGPEGQIVSRPDGLYYINRGRTPGLKGSASGSR